MSAPRTYYLKLSGTPIGPDIEIECEYEIIVPYGAPDVLVTAVYLDGQDIMQSDSPATYGCALDAKSEAEADVAWCESLISKAGWRYVGKGGNDPGGHWRLHRTREYESERPCAS